MKVGDRVTVNGQIGVVKGWTNLPGTDHWLISRGESLEWIPEIDIQESCSMRQICATESPLNPDKH